MSIAAPDDPSVVLTAPLAETAWALADAAGDLIDLVFAMEHSVPRRIESTNVRELRPGVTETTTRTITITVTEEVDQ